MGYAFYETPLGEAGYGVEDVCNQDDCEEKIDRGLAYLCGDQPGSPSEGGCGRWFCGFHLFTSMNTPEIMGGGFCPECIEAFDDPAVSPSERTRKP